MEGKQFLTQAARFGLAAPLAIVPAGWHDWSSLGGKLKSSPTVASWGAGRLDVFVSTAAAG